MEQLTEYTATFEIYEQITEDGWRVGRQCLKVSGKTTIGEIKEWFRLKSKIEPMEIQIIELQTINN